MAVTVIFFSKIVLYFYTNYNDLFEIFLAITMIIISLFIIKDFIPINNKLFLFILIGVLFGYAINQIPDFEMSSNILFLILIGFIAFSFFLVPGISGSAILVTFGQYRLIIQALAELNFITLIPFGVGCLLSLYLMPKLISNLVDKYNEYLMSFFSGLIFIAGLNLFF